jgi:homoserine kinase
MATSSSPSAVGMRRAAPRCATLGSGGALVAGALKEGNHFLVDGLLKHQSDTDTPRDQQGGSGPGPAGWPGLG